MLIYLCDFVHDYLGISTAMFPLNIGYLSAYAKKYCNKKHTTRLFKYPSDFVKAMKSNPADIVGFSNHVWNNNLNLYMSKFAKSINKKANIIFGGANIDNNVDTLSSFLVENPEIDYYSTDSWGEIDFAKFVDSSKPYTPFINDIPSPYLSGTLDKFFDKKLIPIIETNRGCCYSCTFCTQGFRSHNRIVNFDIDRVKAEIDYIARRSKSSPLLQIADSNFGHHERDIEISNYIAKTAKKTGYPRKVNTNWAKANPNIHEIASILNGAGIIISLQSLDPKVLKAVKRVNIPLPAFKNIMDKVNSLGATSGTEIILGLPNETKSSHLDTLRSLFDMKVSYISCYNALILKGSEMSAQRNAGTFRCKTKFRLSDTCYGKYGKEYIFDTEEGIRETDTMTESEILYFRPIHWLIQFMWNYGYYHELLKQIQDKGINPLDFIIKIIEWADKLPSNKLIDLFKDFEREAREEWFDTEKELHDYYVKNFDKITAGEFGKLNGKYIYRILLECKKDFTGLLRDIIYSYDNLKNISELNDLIDKANHNMIDFFNIDKTRIDKAKLKTINQLMAQYEHPNKNLMLRKMSEYMSIKDMFYE